MRMTTLEREALIEGWYRELTDPACLGIDLDVWLWFLHFRARACALSLWPAGAGDGDRYAPCGRAANLTDVIGRMHWMEAFGTDALTKLEGGNLSIEPAAAHNEAARLGAVGPVWLAWTQAESDRPELSAAQQSLCFSARALALLRQSEFQGEEPAEVVIQAASLIAGAAGSVRGDRLLRVTLA